MVILCDSGGWFGTFFLIFPSIGNFIVPTDDFFQKGFGETTNQLSLNGN
jgi:hypothetical protein